MVGDSFEVFLSSVMLTSPRFGGLSTFNCNHLLGLRTEIGSFKFNDPYRNNSYCDHSNIPP